MAIPPAKYFKNHQCCHGFLKIILYIFIKASPYNLKTKHMLFVHLTFFFGL